MTEDDYKQESLNYLDFILKIRPEKTLADTRNMLFRTVPELQEWTNETILVPILEIGLNKVAFVMSQEMIPQLSIEQTMEEREGVKFITRYFDNKEEAKKYLLSL